MKTLLILVIVLLVVVLASLFLMSVGNDIKGAGRYQMIVRNHEEVEVINYGKDGAVAANKPYFYIFDTQTGIAVFFDSQEEYPDYKKQLEKKQVSILD